MSASSPDLVGQVVDGRYLVESTLAEGGMATVLRATDLRLDRPVALKVMRHDLTRDEGFVQGFVSEARAAARLQHPHVVNVFDQGTDGDLVFLAMELVEGSTLREVIRRRSPLSARHALALVIPVAEGLAHAHAAGLVHRDVKPENVLLGGHDGRTVKVADFGLARAAGAGQHPAPELVWGTAAYLAPEQVDPGTSDARTDVYAVGLLLYELLTGRKAFPGQDPTRVAFDHVHQSVPRARDEVPTVPARLDALIARASASDPDDRPQDGAGLLRELLRAQRELTDEELDAVPLPAGATEPIGVRPSGDPTQLVATVHPGATRRIPLARPDDGRGRTGGSSAAPRPHDRAHGDGRYARTTGNVAPSPARPAPPARRRGSALPWVLGLLLVLALGAAGTAWWWNSEGPGVHSAMPPVVDLTEAEARAALDAVELDPVVEPAYSEEVEGGVVMAADHEPGTSLRHGTDVHLTVSQGPERYAVPALAGRTTEEARALLEDVQLRLGAETAAHDEAVPAGQVVASDPAAGAPVPPGTEVGVVVSQGPAPVELPDVTGRLEAEASATLTAAGLDVTVQGEREFDDEVPEGSVVRQSPGPGSVERGTTVTLVLSKGPELVTVPDLFGQQFAEAEEELASLGLTARREDIAGGLFGTVREQSVEPGTEVPKGTEVLLRVV